MAPLTHALWVIAYFSACVVWLFYFGFILTFPWPWFRFPTGVNQTCCPPSIYVFPPKGGSGSFLISCLHLLLLPGFVVPVGSTSLPILIPLHSRKASKRSCSPRLGCFSGLRHQNYQAPNIKYTKRGGGWDSLLLLQVWPVKYKHLPQFYKPDCREFYLSNFPYRPRLAWAISPSLLILFCRSGGESVASKVSYSWIAFDTGIIFQIGSLLQPAYIEKAFSLTWIPISSEWGLRADTLIHFW